MTKLESLLRKGLIYSSIALPLLFNSCKPDPALINSPPVASLSISQTTGDVPLSVTVAVDGTDPDGKSDIKNYQLNFNGEIINSSSPISVSRIITTEGTVSVSGKVVDSQNASSIDSKVINTQKASFIDQTLNVINDVEITYAATLFKVPKATLTINKDGKLFTTVDISDIVQNGNDFSKTFTYATDKLTQGSYDFILKSDNLEKKNNIVILKYDPTISVGTLDMKAYSNLTVPVTLTIKNPEYKDSIHIVSATPLDKKSTLKINGSSIIVHAVPKASGLYSIEIAYGSVTSGILKKTFTGTQSAYPLPVVYEFVQPNDSTLNWYGSGDGDGNNQFNSLDLVRGIEVKNKIYSNSNDTRLYDRLDVDGDGTGATDADIAILTKRLNGEIKYMPGEYNLLPTQTERESWKKKMLVIDDTDKKPYARTFDCKQFSNQLMINFRGFSDADLQKFLKVYPYDIKNNGRFNLPLLEVLITEYDPIIPGKVLFGHLMNTIITGDNAYIWNDLCIIEPQNDAISLQPGQEGAFPGINTLFDVRGPPISLSSGGGLVDMQAYCSYWVKNYTPAVRSWENSTLKFVPQRY